MPGAAIHLALQSRDTLPHMACQAGILVLRPRLTTLATWAVGEHAVGVRIVAPLVLRVNQATFGNRALCAGQFSAVERVHARIQHPELLRGTSR